MIVIKFDNCEILGIYMLEEGESSFYIGFFVLYNVLWNICDFVNK